MECSCQVEGFLDPRCFGVGMCGLKNNMKDHAEDVCECGDYRRDHAGGDGGCFFTPNPDHERKGNDGHFGAGPCHQFELATRALTSEKHSGGEL